MMFTIKHNLPCAESSAKDVHCRILKGHILHRFRGPLSVARSHMVFNESVRIAVETGFPTLVLPLLAEERLRLAAQQVDHQPEHANAA